MVNLTACQLTPGYIYESVSVRFFFLLTIGHVHFLPLKSFLFYARYYTQNETEAPDEISYNQEYHLFSIRQIAYREWSLWCNKRLSWLGLGCKCNKSQSPLVFVSSPLEVVPFPYFEFGLRLMQDQVS